MSEADSGNIKHQIERVMNNMTGHIDPSDVHANIPIMTGFTDYDDCTGGLQSELIVLGGRSGMGKTSLALNVAEYICIKQQLPAVIFSLDMPGEALTLRLISSLTGINSMRIRKGQLTDEEWPLLTSAVSMLTENKLRIIDKIMNINEIIEKAEIQINAHGVLGLIVIDCLQMIPNHNPNIIRVYNIQEILIALKAFSRKHDVPIILLSQLSRANLESRADKRPLACDIPDCDSIEAMADKVLFLYRDEIYNYHSPDAGTAELIMAKNKMGVECRFRLKFTPEICRFENFTRSYQ
jgi:replicative DNA helicase